MKDNQKDILKNLFSFCRKNKIVLEADNLLMFSPKTDMRGMLFDYAVIGHESATFSKDVRTESAKDPGFSRVEVETYTMCLNKNGKVIEKQKEKK